jgi:hypothetical protein
MDVQAVWLVVLAVAAPIAGVVGFALQLRQVKKSRLENEKLLLEIAVLKQAASKREQRVQPATTDEVLRFGMQHPPMFSRKGQNPNPTPWPQTSLIVRIKDALLTAGVIGLALLLLGYLIYDLYRLGRFVLSTF